jgi:hypothetical protein
MHLASDLRRPQRLTLVAIVVIALGAIAFASRPTASAQTPATRTLQFTELEKGSTFTHIRNTKTKNRRSNLQGDLIVFTNPVADAAGKVVGKLHVKCVTTTGAPNFLKSKMTCDGIMVVTGGTLTFQALVSPGTPTSNGAVTGGTGAYANARGTLVSVEGRSGSKDTITLVG